MRLLCPVFLERNVSAIRPMRLFVLAALLAASAAAHDHA
jgi:hypothetical protein